MLRRDFVRGAEMHFRKSPQGRRAFFLDDQPRRRFHRRRNAASERQAGALPVAIEPGDERFARQDRRRRDREIRFRFCPLVELNALAMLQERYLDHARIGEFIG